MSARRTGLEPLAPSHDSSSGLFSFDRFRPTYREVLQRPFPTFAFERLYAPVGSDGQPLQTINEAVHRSVIDRYGKVASYCTTDASGTCDAKVYRPRNLTPLFSTGDAPISDARVSD